MFIRNACVAVAGLALAVSVVGCAAQQRQDVVPPTAKLQMSGSGQKVYTSPGDGMVYVFDKPADRLIWSGQVRQGQMVQVDPQRNEVSLNGSAVSNSVRIGEGRIDIYFEPASTSLNSEAANLRRDRDSDQSRQYYTPNTVTTTPGQRPGSVTVTPQPVTITPSVTVEQQGVPANSVVPSTQPSR